LIKRKPLFIFFSVIKALFLRELESRISQGKSGLFWTFTEPFFQVFVFVALRSALIQSSSYNVPLFMAVGFVPFAMFRSILSSSSGAFMANKGLFNYKQVKPIDTILSRALVELFLTCIVAMIFLVIGFFLHFDNLLPENTLMVLFAYFWFWIFAIGIGLIVGIGNTFFVSIGKIVSISTFGLMIFSAVFYPIVTLPPAAQEILLYNPLVHFMEMIHGSYLYELDTQFVDYRYMLLWTVIPWFIGIWLYEMLERKIISA